MLGAALKEGFRASGLNYPRATVVTVSLEARLSLVKTGRFVTIFPGSATFSSKQAEIVVLPVKLPIAPVSRSQGALGWNFPSMKAIQRSLASFSEALRSGK